MKVKVIPTLKVIPNSKIVKACEKCYSRFLECRVCCISYESLSVLSFKAFPGIIQNRGTQMITNICIILCHIES